MAGMKGRSGGARPNSGPKRKPPATTVAQPDAAAAESAPVPQEPLAFLEAVMRGLIDPSPSQLKAAIAAAKYRHQVPAAGGKKGEAAKNAQAVAGGKFGARSAPALRVVNE